MAKTKTLEKILAGTLAAASLFCFQPKNCGAQRDLFISKEYHIKMESPLGYFGELPEANITIEVGGETKADFYDLKIGIYPEGWSEEKFSVSGFYKIDPNRSSIDVITDKKTDIAGDIWEMNFAVDPSKTTKTGVSGTMRPAIPYEDAAIPKTIGKIVSFSTDRTMEFLGYLGLGLYIPLAGNVGHSAFNKIVGSMKDFTEQQTNDMLMLLKRTKEVRRIPNYVLNEMPKEVYAKTASLLLNRDKDTGVELLINVGLTYEKLPDIYEVGKLENILLGIDLSKPMEWTKEEDIKKFLEKDLYEEMLEEKRDAEKARLESSEENNEPRTQQEAEIVKICKIEDYLNGERDAFLVNYYNIDDGPEKENIVSAVVERGTSRENRVFLEYFYIFPPANIKTDSASLKPLIKFGGFPIGTSWQMHGVKDLSILSADFDDNGKQDIFVSINSLYDGSHTEFSKNDFEYRLNLVYLNLGKRFARINLGEWKSNLGGIYLLDKEITDKIEEGIINENPFVIKKAIKKKVMELEYKIINDKQNYTNLIKLKEN